MSSQAPFRQPCGGPPKRYRCCFSNDPVPVLRDRYTNVTTVPSPVDGSPIPPFERWTPDPSGALACEVHHCSTGPYDAPCVAWPRPYTTNTWSHTAGDQVNFAVAHKRGFKNVMAFRYWSGVPGYGVARDGGLDTTQCCGDGSIKKWNGYQSSIPGTKYLTVAIASEDKLTDYHYDGSGNLTGTTVAFDDTAAVSQSINATSGLLSFSGFAVSPNSSSNHALTHLSMAFWTPSQIVEFVSTALDDGGLGGTTSCTDTSITVLDGSGRVVETLVWDLAAGTSDHKRYEYSGTGAQFLTEEHVLNFSDAGLFYTLTINTWSSFGGPDLELGAQEIITVNATLGGSNTSASIYTDIKDNLLSLWPLNDDALYPWRTDLKVSAAPLVSRDEVFTNAFTADFYTVNGDGTLSLNTADTREATGDILGAPLPAGYEGYFQFGYDDWAGCCYHNPSDETQSWDWYPLGWGMQVGTFNTAAACSLPLNATQWTNYFQSVNKPQGAFLFYNDPSNQLFPPDCITSGTEAIPNPISGSLEADALWAGKYAECLDPWPSQNFARPAGAEKFAFDETRVYCVTNASGSGEGSTWTVTNTIDGTTPPDGTDFSGTWGGASVDGFYTVAGYASGVLTLGAKAWDVATDWASKSNGDEATCFGKLRWPIVPSLLGRIGITPDTAGATMTFATAQPAFGLAETAHTEQVDLFDASMTSLASNITATRITTAWASGTGYTVGQLIEDSNKNVQQCTIAGTSGGSAPAWATGGTTTDGGVTWTFLGSADSVFHVGASYPLARWVMIHGSAAYYMNDTDPKGDYALLQWWSDFRSKGEYDRLTGLLDCSGTQVTGRPTSNAGGGPIGTATQFANFTQTGCCLPNVPCSPAVVCISPNGETFPNGHTYPFPDTFVCDEQYGSKWWAWVQVTMTDLFWQTPHRPCNIGPTDLWKEDGGTCAENTGGTPATYYFGHRPQVEARITLPHSDGTCCHGYGAAQDETPPALPADVQIGWLSPVNYDTGDVALPPLPPGALSASGAPAGANTAWDLHSTFCAAAAGGCRFDYILPGC